MSGRWFDRQLERLDLGLALVGDRQPKLGERCLEAGDLGVKHFDLVPQVVGVPRERVLDGIKQGADCRRRKIRMS